MINIIGLGNAGCKIAEELSQYPQYKIYKIDVGLPDEDNCFSLPKRKNPEDYESKFPSKVLGALKKIKGKVVLIVGGGGRVSCAALRVLECVRDTSIEVIYIQPDASTAGLQSQQLDKITSNVFQEYARSGAFERLYMVSNGEIERSIGNIPVSQYYPRLNSIIASTFHMMNVYKNTPPSFSRFSDHDGISRISTFGVGTLDKVVDHVFFPLDYVSEKEYYFAINQEQLDEDAELLSNIKRRVKQEDSTIKVGFGVYPTPYEQNYIYILANTKIIQGVNYDE